MAGPPNEERKWGVTKSSNASKLHDTCVKHRSREPNDWPDPFARTPAEVVREATEALPIQPWARPTQVDMEATRLFREQVADLGFSEDVRVSPLISPKERFRDRTLKRNNGDTWRCTYPIHVLDPSSADQVELAEVRCLRWTCPDCRTGLVDLYASFVAEDLDGEKVWRVDVDPEWATTPTGRPVNRAWQRISRQLRRGGAEGYSFPTVGDPGARSALVTVEVPGAVLVEDVEDEARKLLANRPLGQVRIGVFGARQEIPEAEVLSEEVQEERTFHQIPGTWDYELVPTGTVPEIAASMGLTVEGWQSATVQSGWRVKVAEDDPRRVEFLRRVGFKPRLPQDLPASHWLLKDVSWEEWVLYQEGQAA